MYRDSSVWGWILHFCGTKWWLHAKWRIECSLVSGPIDRLPLRSSIILVGKRKGAGTSLNWMFPLCSESLGGSACLNTTRKCGGKVLMTRVKLNYWSSSRHLRDHNHFSLILNKILTTNAKAWFMSVTFCWTRFFKWNFHHAVGHNTFLIRFRCICLACTIHVTTFSYKDTITFINAHTYELVLLNILICYAILFISNLSLM